MFSHSANHNLNILSIIHQLLPPPYNLLIIKHFLAYYNTVITPKKIDVSSMI